MPIVAFIEIICFHHPLYKLKMLYMFSNVVDTSPTIDSQPIYRLRALAEWASE